VTATPSSRRLLAGTVVLAAALGACLLAPRLAGAAPANALAASSSPTGASGASSAATKIAFGQRDGGESAMIAFGQRDGGESS
jgi:hypothetical protein